MTISFHTKLLLIFRRYFIGTDQDGTPIAVFDAKGKLVKEMVRSPYGRIIRDSNPSMDLPIDFRGGLIDQYTHLIHMRGNGDGEGRVFDTVLGQWMTPRLFGGISKISDGIRSPFDIFSYRFMNNDPINIRQEFFHMTNIGDWLRMFGMNIDLMMGSSYADSTQHRPSTAAAVKGSSQKNLGISVGLINQQTQSLNNLKQSDLTRPTSYLLTSTNDQFRHPILASRLATKVSSFGQGLLVSDLNGRAMVTIVNDGSNLDVVQSVFATILNASYVMEVSHSGKEEYHFLKVDQRSYLDDYQQLQRLSGSYNVSSEAFTAVVGGNGRNNLKSSQKQGRKLCAFNRLSSICVVYYPDKRIAARHFLKKAKKMAIEKAWRQAKSNLNSGIIADWTKSERNELQQKGMVRGYSAMEVHNVHSYPQLIGQFSNIKFVKRL